MLGVMCFVLFVVWCMVLDSCFVVSLYLLCVVLVLCVVFGNSSLLFVVYCVLFVVCCLVCFGCRVQCGHSLIGVFCVGGLMIARCLLCVVVCRVCCLVLLAVC